RGAPLSGKHRSRGCQPLLGKLRHRLFEHAHRAIVTAVDYLHGILAAQQLKIIRRNIQEIHYPGACTKVGIVLDYILREEPARNVDEDHVSWSRPRGAIEIGIGRYENSRHHQLHWKRDEQGKNTTALDHAPRAASPLLWHQADPPICAYQAKRADRSTQVAITPAVPLVDYQDQAKRAHSHKRYEQAVLPSALVPHQWQGCKGERYQKDVLPSGEARQVGDQYQRGVIE